MTDPNTRERYPAGVPCWIDTVQPDPEAAADFYGGLFGWTFELRGSPTAPYRIAQLDGHDVGGLAAAPDAGTAATWNTYVAVDEVRAALSAVVAEGGAVLAEPEAAGEAGTGAAFTDPDGCPLWLWQPGRRLGAQVVNSPGTWNWSNLAATDPQRAKAFYRAVFGWEALDLGGATMLTRPGYSDVLAERDPDLRRRHAEAGAPPGFSDAIAWLSPAGDGPPGWSVTFAVDDTDAVVERAVALGATVLTEPYDVDAVRLATLRDPQGAELTVNRYDPDAQRGEA